MNLTRATLEKRAISYFAAFLLIFGGLGAYLSLGQLEDPEFTVKTAAITVAYPGASAQQVEQEVVDLIETQLQEMVLSRLISRTSTGLTASNRYGTRCAARYATSRTSCHRARKNP
jgi:multidrug efflux pump subunit AcrB